MTELVIAKVAVPVAGVAGGVMFSLIAIDSSVANVIRDAIQGAVTIGMGFLVYKQAALNKKMDAQKDKLEETFRKADVIAGHVNSEKTKDAGEIARLQGENKLLREIMADKNETAALLAQSAVQAQPEKKAIAQETSTGVTSSNETNTNP